MDKQKRYKITRLALAEWRKYWTELLPEFSTKEIGSLISMRRHFRRLYVGIFTSGYLQSELDNKQEYIEQFRYINRELKYIIAEKEKLSTNRK